MDCLPEGIKLPRWCRNAELTFDCATRHSNPGQETVIRTFTAIIATFGVLGVFAARAPAHAHDDDDNGGWRHHEWQEHQWREHEWRERAWRSYAPPSVAYAPPPAYYVAPPSAYYAPPPSRYEAPGVSIDFSFR